jgi:hypothetical protein
VSYAQGATLAAMDVLAERSRQVSAEGWTPEHDDAHSDGSLARAAGVYALFADSRPGSFFAENSDTIGAGTPLFWPWAPTWWKPTDRRRNLIKAGALILAEIERLDRAADAAQHQVSANG